MRTLKQHISESFSVNESDEKKELLALDKKLFAGGDAIDAGTEWEEYLDVNFPKLKNLKDIDPKDIDKALKGAKSIAKKHKIK
jgi:hypothetical protein